jgi:hypothetical protein
MNIPRRDMKVSPVLKFLLHGFPEFPLISTGVSGTKYVRSLAVYQCCLERFDVCTRL